MGRRVAAACAAVLAAMLVGVASAQRSAGTIVTTAAQFQAQVTAAEHIVVAKHMDITGLPTADGVLLPEPTLLSIQGNCSGSAPAVAGGPALLALKPKQCVILFEDVAMLFVSGGTSTWLANLYFRAARPYGVKDPVARAVGLSNSGAGSVWMDGVTMQGDGVDEARGLYVGAGWKLHMKGGTIANMKRSRGPVADVIGSASFDGCTFSSSSANAGSGAITLKGKPNAKANVLLKTSTFAAGISPAGVLIMNHGNLYVDAGAQGAVAAGTTAQAAASAPAASFASAGDAGYTSIKAVAPSLEPIIAPVPPTVPPPVPVPVPPPVPPPVPAPVPAPVPPPVPVAPPPTPVPAPIPVTPPPAPTLPPPVITPVPAPPPPVVAPAPIPVPPPEPTPMPAPPPAADPEPPTLPPPPPTPVDAPSPAEDTGSGSGGGGSASTPSPAPPPPGGADEVALAPVGDDEGPTDGTVRTDRPDFAPTSPTTSGRSLGGVVGGAVGGVVVVGAIILVFVVRRKRNAKEEVEGTAPSSTAADGQSYTTASYSNVSSGSGSVYIPLAGAGASGHGSTWFGRKPSKPQEGKTSKPSYQGFDMFDNDQHADTWRATVAGNGQTVVTPASATAGFTVAPMTELPPDAPMTVVPPTQPASRGIDGRPAFDELHDALDEMMTSSTLLFGTYKVMGAVERRAGGQGLVQFVNQPERMQQYAVKFFLQRDAFEHEAGIFMHPKLKDIMFSECEVHSNANGAMKTPSGYVFPPSITVERGQSLNEWMKTMKPKFSTIVDAMTDVATRLGVLHAAGFTHRDIKPGNLMRLQRQYGWALIDFGCAAQSGYEAPLAFSLKYAAPETVKAYEGQKSRMIVTAAVDIWALGVIMLEMVSRQPAFERTCTEQQILARISGREPLPWEDEETKQQVLAPLRGLRRLVLQCLHRVPEQRPSAEQVVNSLSGLFDGHTTISSTG